MSHNMDGRCRSVTRLTCVDVLFQGILGYIRAWRCVGRLPTAFESEKACIVVNDERMYRVCLRSCVLDIAKPPPRRCFRHIPHSAIRISCIDFMLISTGDGLLRVAWEPDISRSRSSADTMPLKVLANRVKSFHRCEAQLIEPHRRPAKR
jgi:hypothetical protein